MAITRHEIKNGPSKFDLLMALFGEDDMDGSKVNAPRLKTFRVTYGWGGSSTFEADLSISLLARGEWEFGDDERVWYLHGGYWIDGNHHEDYYTALYWPHARSGILFFGQDAHLAVANGKVYSDGEIVHDFETIQSVIGLLSSPLLTPA